MSSYATNVIVDYGDGHRSRGLAILGILHPLKLLAAIPHLIVLYFLHIVAGLVAWIGYWVTLFAGRLPNSFQDLIGGVVRWSVRVQAWVAQLVDDYPPFRLSGGDFPVDFVNEDGTDERHRVLGLLGIILLKPLLLLPHMVVLFFVSVAALVMGWIGYWAVLFTGRFPESLFRLLEGTIRWSARLTAWHFGLTDHYPPFALDNPPPNTPGDTGSSGGGTPEAPARAA
ncbi:MAG: hypothetical protein JJLCMIEE_01267 [Acidimicrobiales bacterium]|nr:MAG: DUF4389 domain-containing protein [Actinomycetota bacterium]MBV6508207.1 hypothetical protein [Acidimicrobiales bacterium]RIK07281.1 MAG: hypothetical protein DCC48_04160 [Acidobacteriota bacterium]